MDIDYYHVLSKTMLLLEAFWSFRVKFFSLCLTCLCKVSDVLEIKLSGGMFFNFDMLSLYKCYALSECHSQAEYGFMLRIKNTRY